MSHNEGKFDKKWVLISFIKNLTTHNQVPENQIFVNNTAVDSGNLLYATNQAKYLVS